MGKVTKLNLENADVSGHRRLHLRDIQDDNPEPRGTVGAQMHAARLALGEDISDVASQLRIRRDQIEAIEGGHFDKMPGRAYSIGFVRSYAEYLGLDEAEMVTAFKAEFDAAAMPGTQLNFPDVEDEARVPRGAVIVIVVLVIAALYGVWMLTVSADRMVEERATTAPSVVPTTRVPIVQPGSVQPAGVQPAGVQPGGAAVARPETRAETRLETPRETPAEDTPDRITAQTGGEAGEVAQAPAAQAEEVVTEQTEQDVPAETASPLAGTIGAATPPEPADVVAPQEIVAPAPVNPIDQVSPLETGPERAWEGFVYGQQNHDSRIFIRANAQTWVRIEDADGNVLLSRTLRAGESYRAPNRPGMVLATRNAGGLQLFVDGKPAGAAGSAGQVLTDLPLDPAALSGQ